MLLAIDIGNTNVTLGVFRDSKSPDKVSRSRIGLLSSDESPGRSALANSWRLSTSAIATADEYGTKILDLLHYAAIERGEIKAIAIASVVPHLNSVFDELSQKYFKIQPAVVGDNLKVSLATLYENPKEVGADRIVNAVAAFAKFGGPCIVVDFGTATTFDCVNKKGEYAGGAIAPGPMLASESLAAHTAKLPRVEIVKPQRVIGKNTIESIQSGLYYGYVSLVDGMIERLKGQLGAGCKVVATGGLAGLLCSESKFVKPEVVFPDLTLDGIRIVFERHKQKEG